MRRHAGGRDDGGHSKVETEPREEDGIKLAEIDITRSGGPFHLINATVNNPDLGEINLRGRRAELFVFSSKFSGNNRLGYCTTERLEKVDRSLNLGTALAVSAAAVSPNMGQKTSNPLIVFLSAMLNVRLGYWLPAPKMVNDPPTHWTGLRRSHFVGPFYFFLEMFGLPRRLRERYINLSDAGHLENLGILELLRRRCEYVIAIDAEADPGMKFNGLATVIRLARTDLGVNIDIDLDDLRTDEHGLSRRHWVLGTIDYDDDETGTLLYIKASVTGSENEYVTEYRTRNPGFPHEPTGDQFFDEVRFEAYRSLGHKAGASIFHRSSSELASRRSLERSFEWFRKLDGVDETFAELSKRDTSNVLRRDYFFTLLDRRLAIDKVLTDQSMSGYAAELIEMPGVSEIPDIPGDADEGHLAREFRVHQIVNQQLQLMEVALFGLGLHDPKNRRRKSNLGWMNLFRRWSRSKTFKRHWAASIGNYGAALMSFCKEEFDLDLCVTWTERRDLENLSARQRKLLDEARKADGAETMELHVYAARIVTSDDADSATNGLGVANAIVGREGGKLVLVNFEVFDSHRSGDVARMLLEGLKKSEFVTECRRGPLLGPYFRMLMRLGYEDTTRIRGEADAPVSAQDTERV